MRKRCMKDQELQEPLAITLNPFAYYFILWFLVKNNRSWLSDHFYNYDFTNYYKFGITKSNKILSLLYTADIKYEDNYWEKKSKFDELVTPINSDIIDPLLDP